jgi:hypothetical protein
LDDKQLSVYQLGLSTLPSTSLVYLPKTLASYFLFLSLPFFAEAAATTDVAVCFSMTW